MVEYPQEQPHSTDAFPPDEIQSRDKTTFAEVYSESYDTIYWYMYRRGMPHHTAEDLTQESFTKAFANLDKYADTGKSFEAWLMQIAINTLKDYLKSAQYNRVVHDENHTDHMLHRDNTEKSALASIALEKVGDYLLNQASEPQRNVIQHTVIEGMGHAEYGETIGSNSKAVKESLARARRALRSALGNIDQFI